MGYEVKKLTEEAVELLRQLISIPSVSRDEQLAADCLQDYIELRGVETSRKGNNVWCMSPGFDLQKPTLLLNSHIDTVKPVSGWLKDPFTPKLEINGKLYGLGSNDAGASVVSLLHVFLPLCERGLPYNLLFLASCEEEVSGKGGIESVLPDLPPIDFAIVGEPTGMHPAIHPQMPLQNDLTKREIEVLSLVARGFINKEIANKLNISLTTVITHRKNITEKLGIKSVSGLTIYAVMRGYVEADSI